MDSRTDQLLHLLRDAQGHHVNEIWTLLRIGAEEIPGIVRGFPEDIARRCVVENDVWRIGSPVAWFDEESLPYASHDPNVYILHREVGSTNDAMIRDIREGVRGVERRIHVAHHQTEGRGTQGRKWEGRPGRSLMFTMCWKEARQDYDGSSLTLVVALSLAKVLRRLGVKLKVKWPNDLMVGDSKIAGILVERLNKDKTAYYVIGVGVNCYPMDPPPPGSTSVGDHVPEYDPDDVFHELVAEIKKDLHWYFTEGFSHFQLEYLFCFRELGRAVKLIRQNKVFLEGMSVGVDQKGHLLVVDERGVLHRISSGEVTLRHRSGEAGGHVHGVYEGLSSEPLPTGDGADSAASAGRLDAQEAQDEEDDPELGSGLAGALARDARESRLSSRFDPSMDDPRGALVGAGIARAREDARRIPKVDEFPEVTGASAGSRGEERDRDWDGETQDQAASRTDAGSDDFADLGPEDDQVDSFEDESGECGSGIEDGEDLSLDETCRECDAERSGPTARPTGERARDPFPELDRIAPAEGRGVGGAGDGAGAGADFPVEPVARKDADVRKALKRAREDNERQIELNRELIDSEKELVLVDCGNSQVKWCWVRGNEFLGKFRAGYADLSDLRRFVRKMGRIVLYVGTQVCGDEKKRMVERAVGKPIIWLASERHAQGIRNHYRYVEEHGSDRWFNALGARHFTRNDCVIVSCGTAITCDALTRQNAYLGGTISPGFNLMRKSLSMNTARLKRNPGKVYDFPTTTPNALATGIMSGACGVVQIMHRKLKKRSGGHPVDIILTGGGAWRILEYFEPDPKETGEVKLVDNLIFYGLLKRIDRL